MKKAKILCTLLVSAMVVGTSGNVVSAAPKKVTKKVTMKVKKKKVLSVKASAKRVKWKTSNKKIVKIQKQSGKKKTKATIYALKKGSCTITARSGKKIYTWKIRVAAGKQVAVATPTAVAVTPAAVQTVTPAVSPQPTAPAATNKPKLPAVNPPEYASSATAASIHGSLGTPFTVKDATSHTQEYMIRQAMVRYIVPDPALPSLTNTAYVQIQTDDTAQRGTIHVQLISAETGAIGFDEYVPVNEYFQSTVELWMLDTYRINFPDKK